jgi:DNA-binding transcriptional LysR family regulator
MRVSAPIAFSVRHLAPALADFQKRYPRVELELGLNDRLVDLVDEGFDMAIRISRLADSSLVARRIAMTSLVVVAAPTYLERAGAPTHPSELAGHDALIYTLAPKPDEWIFSRDGENIVVKLNGKLFVNNGDFIAAAAIDGAGIAMLPSFIAYDAIKAGSLVEVLSNWVTRDIGIYAVYPQTRALPAKTRALIDFLVERFGPEPEWERRCTEVRNARAQAVKSK